MMEIEVSTSCGRTPTHSRVLAGVLTVTSCLVLTLFMLLGADPAKAATFEVNSTNDPGDGTCDASECTLREAIADANANGEADTITFASGLGDTITLTTGELTIQNDGPGEDLTIEGPGTDQLSVGGNGQSAVFTTNTGSDATIEGLTITGGQSGTSGGGILNDGGTLTVTQSAVTGNSAANNGGGIFSFDGTLTVDASTISGNSVDASNGQGGGIYFTYQVNPGALTINESTISGNSAGTGGGVVSFTLSVTANNPEPTERTTITNSTISGNGAEGNGGGGVYNLVGLTVIENTTITDNSAPDGTGGGVASAGQVEARTEVGSSIVAANEQPNGSSGTDVDHDTTGGGANTFASDGYNIIGAGNATSAFAAPGDETGVGNPGLGPLAGNGGPTETHALLTGSPALDKLAATSACPPPDTDQRGVDRPQGTSCDSGSYEAEPSAPEPGPITVDTAQDGGATAGDCSLRRAILAANTNTAVGGCAAGRAGGADRIVFSLGQGSSTITLGSTLPVVTGRAGLTVDGGQDARITVSGDGQVRVLVVKKGAGLTLRRLTVADGSANAPGNNPSETAASGGGVSNRGGTLTVVRSTFSDNEALSFGGAISNLGAAGEVSVVNSTFANNGAEAGGAIANAGKLGVSYSTFAGNTADFVGGGINNANVASARATIAASAFSANSNGNVNNASAGGASKGRIIDGGYNISSDRSYRFTASTSSIGTNPRLQPGGPRDNGGPTDTKALQGDSPAINAVPRGRNNCGTSLKADQRGTTRPQSNRCDAGAYELEVLR